MEMIKVILVDDQVILLDGLKAILETDEQIKVIATAASGEEAIKLITKQTPDVVLMDIRMQEMNGVECTKRIKQLWPQVAVLILTTFNDEAYILEAIKNGACGYLLKDINGERLLQAVKDASKGCTLLPSNVAEKIINRLSEPVMTTEKKLKIALGLTDREAELAMMLAQGFTNKQIASALFLSEGTIKNYISMIYKKIELEDRTLAAMKIKELMS